MTTSALPGSDADEFDVLQHGVLFVGHDQAGAARKAGEQRRRLGQDVFHAVAGAGHARFDGGTFGRRQLADLQQPVDEQAAGPFRSARVRRWCAARKAGPCSPGPP